MPTGYTNIIKNDISFKEFTLRCARNFGACITMRDDAWDKEIPKFKPTDYHIKELKKLRKKLSELKKMSNAQADKKSKQEQKDKIKYNDDAIQKNNDLY